VYTTLQKAQRVVNRWLWICSDRFGITCEESSVCLEIYRCFVEDELYIWYFGITWTTLFTEEQFKECWVIWRRPQASWKDLSVESGHCQAEDKSRLIYHFYYFTDFNTALATVFQSTLPSRYHYHPAFTIHSVVVTGHFHSPTSSVESQNH